MKEKMKIFNNRYLILGICFLMFFFVIILRLFKLQIVEGESYNIKSQSSVLKESTVTAPRGKIVDRYGTPIAVNRQGFIVKIVKTNIKTDELNEMLYKLAVVFEKNKKSYNDSLTKYLTYDPKSSEPFSFNGKSVEEILKWQKNKDRLNISKEEELQDTPEGLFRYLREVKFKIDPSYTDEQAYKIMKLRYEILIDNWNFSQGGSVLLARDVGMEVVAEIEERHSEFPGIITDVEPMREYLDAYNEAHILGYVGAINAEELEAHKDEGYDSNDIIGKTGIEKSAESYLRGKDGKKTIEVDINGRQIKQTETVPAIPGSDIVLTIDRNLQKVAMESLKNNIEKIRNRGGKGNFGDANAGAVVAMDVNTGEILAMASYPSYDPAIFLAGPEDKAAREARNWLNDDRNTDRNGFNRVTQGTYAPGSTFKPLTAIAALESGVISPSNSRRYDAGKANFGGRDFFCLEFKYGHGWLDLKKALETSCNIYFHDIGFATGIDKIAEWGNLFGLGRKTGIDLPYESAGYIASRETKKLRVNENWWPADTAQAAIGQSFNQFTPLQLVRYISAIANGGKLYKPYLIKNVIKYDGSTVNETEPVYETIPVKKSTIDAVKEGMVAVTSSVDGTAKEYFKDFPYTVAGKTGTAQTTSKGDRSDNALFVCYVPADDPQIAIAVVIERGVWGSYTAPVARDILDAYFGLTKTNTEGDVLKPEEPVFVP